MKKLTTFLLIAICAVSILSPVLASAGISDTIKQNLTGVAKGAEFKESLTLPELVGLIISILLSILGVVFVILMVYGGIVWMTSYGNEQKITKAKDTIIAAVIGLIIVLASYAITRFVVDNLVKATVT